MEIIIPTKDIHLKDFIGDYSFLGLFWKIVLWVPIGQILGTSEKALFWKRTFLKTLLSLRKFENKSN